MSNQTDIEQKIAELYRRHRDYRPGAYRFVLEAVGFTVRRRNAARHVSAAELLAGARDYAEAQFGPLAGAVLTDWGVMGAPDLGTLVYRLIGEHLLGANQNDAPEDFHCDFELFPPITAGERRRRRPAVPIIA